MICYIFCFHFHIGVSHPSDVLKRGKHNKSDLKVLPQLCKTKKQPPSFSKLMFRGTSGEDSKVAESCDDEIPAYGESAAIQSNYYTIALLGKSGQGKSTTGNKLLEIDITTHSSDSPIKEWKCFDQALLKCSINDEPNFAFICSEGANSVTKMCQMLSNENTRIRVLDVPGFADSEATSKTTIQRNAALIDSVLQIQCELSIGFHRILYFLPNRGVIERADAYLQDELRTLYHYFGDSVFKCMVIVATKQRKDKNPFDDDDYKQMSKVLLSTMEKVTNKKNPICPPIVYLPFNATSEEVLTIVQTAPVESDKSLDPRVMFQAYFGDDRWEDWIQQFESAATERSLDSRAKLQMMKTILTGHTKVAFDKITESYEVQYDLAKSEVQYDLAKSELQNYIYSARYTARKKNDDEEWKNFADDLCKLARNAFPSMQQDTIEEEVIANIKSQAIQLVGHLDLPDNCLSLDTILTIVTATEAIPVAYTAEDTGKGWNDWIARFEWITTQRSLDECTRVQWLKTRLAGKALSIFYKHSLEQCTKYQVAKDTFCKVLYMSLFESSEKLRRQRWDTYADELKLLADKGYPDIPPKERERIVLNHILCQVTNPSFRCMHWNTLNEAVIAIAATDEIPDAYDDETGGKWETWLDNFNNKCGLLDNKQKLQWLKIRISDKLLPVFERVCKEVKDDYVKVTKSFQETLVSIGKFKSRKKLPSEKWKELCTDLCLLAEKFVPNEKRERVVLQRFLSIIKNDGISLELLKLPETLSEAVSIVSARENVQNIQKYSGEENWEQWLTNFESALFSKEGVLTEDTKVALLRSHLGGKALRVFESLPCDAKSNYDEAKRATAIQLYIQKFESKRKSDENWKQFANDLNEIAEKAYPDMQDSMRKDLVLKHFLDDPTMSNDVRMFKPEAIEVALDIIIAMQVILKYSGDADVSWEQWINHFEYQATQYQLNMTAKVLCVCLTGAPRKVFEEAVNIETASYENAKCTLEKELYKTLFESRAQQENEFVDDFVNDLKFLAEKAYPGSKSSDIDERVLKKLKERLQFKRGSVVLDQDIWNTLSGFILTWKVYVSMKSCEGADWDEWIAHFENTVAKATCESDDNAKLQCFEACISGEAKTFYEDSQYYRKDFKCAVHDVRIQIYTKLFQSRVKIEAESWRNLAIGLYKIAQKAYPDCSESERDKKVLSRFLTVANSRALNQQKPSSTDFAVKLLEYWEIPSNGVQLSCRACTKCCLRSVQGQHVVEDEDGHCIPYAQSKCHAEMVDKYTIFQKIRGGLLHTLTFGFTLLVTDKPGFTNSDKVCCNCRDGFGTAGCLAVRQEYTIRDTNSDCVYKSAVDHTYTK